VLWKERYKILWEHVCRVFHKTSVDVLKVRK